jgi:hypothetical protein
VRWGFRTFAALAVAAATVGSSVAGAATTAKGSGLSIGHSCTYLTTRQVQKVFGSPVTIDPTNRGGATVISSGCSYLVGPPGQLTGALVALDLFPFFPPPGQNAIDALESQRATDSLGGLTLVDAKLGQKSYVDLDRSIIVVAPNKKFAFTLQWLPTGGSSAGGSLDAKTQKQLTTLAKQIIARAPK